jgi:phosphatidylglycerophosphatase A
MALSVEESNDLFAGLIRKFNLNLWIAQGFGTGLIPFAPGTFGSIVGVLWFGLLMVPGNLGFFVAGTLAGIALSVWFCGLGEKILGRKDPPSVVLDEIAAMPVCFAAWVGILAWKLGSFPSLADFFGPRNWPLMLGVFAAFRLFDITKPWPVGRSQALPGGWGVTIDDVLAAVYVNVVVLAVYAGKTLLISNS